MNNKISIINGCDNLELAPTDEDLLIIYKDDSGDYTNYYTVVAGKAGKGKNGISGNQEITQEILCWARLPELENIQYKED